MPSPVFRCVAVALMLLAVPATASAAVQRPPWPTPAPAIERATPTDCETEGGHYDETRNVIALCRSGDAFARAHEAGHAFDHFHLSDGERRRFARLTGRTGRPWQDWHIDETLPDGTQVVSLTRSSLEEVFADAYAGCRIGLDPDHGWTSSTDYYPSARTHRRVCAFITRAARLL